MEDDLLEQIIFNEFDDDEDVSDEVEKEDEPIMLVNAEGWKRMGDPSFKQHFRMDRALFEVLIIVVGRHMLDTGRIIRRGMSIDLSLMMTLYILATPDSFRSVGVKFGVAKPSVHNQYCTIIAVLRELRGAYIKWPTRWEKVAIARNFEDAYGYPGVLGCIDGTHIQITALLEQPQRYFNWRQDYSILVQAVCDDRLLFRDVYVGQPGLVGDARMFQRSPLGTLLLRRLDLTDDLHLLDEAYTLTSNLLVPYRDYGKLTQRQRTHNYHLSRCRSCIERSFVLLKGKWRRLKYFPSSCIEYANDHILACLVLHNFIILNGEQYEDENEEFVMVPDDINEEQLLEQAREEGTMKREYIATFLHPEN